jgi:hypothetical protein
MPAPTNISLSDEVAELIRQINGLPLEPAERGYCLWLLAQLLDDMPNFMKTYQPLPPGDARRSSTEEALRRLAFISLSNKQLLLAALKD